MIHMDDGVLIWAQKLAPVSVEFGVADAGLGKTNRRVSTGPCLVEELLQPCIISFCNAPKVVKSEQLVLLVALLPL